MHDDPVYEEDFPPREITHHRVNGCNDKLIITAEDPSGAGGANHRYSIRGFNTETNASCPFQELYGKPSDHTTILFQNGAIPENGTNGVTQEALLAIVEDRLISFQEGPFACEENEQALAAVRLAQHLLQTRTRARVARGVEGTHVV